MNNYGTIVTFTEQATIPKGLLKGALYLPTRRLGRGGGCSLLVVSTVSTRGRVRIPTAEHTYSHTIDQAKELSIETDK